MNWKGHNHKMKAISTRLTEFVHDIIDSRRKSRASLSKRSTTSDTVDFLDILLDMVERTKDNEMPVVDGHVKAVLMVRIVKGLLMVKLMMIKNLRKIKEDLGGFAIIANPLMKVASLLL
jgi:hypothetical protein